MVVYRVVDEAPVKRFGSVSPPVPIDGPATRFGGGNNPNADWVLASHNSDKQRWPSRSWPKDAEQAPSGGCNRGSKSRIPWKENRCQTHQRRTRRAPTP